MSKQTINIGASPNDGTGTPLRTSFDYTNQNFTELYTALGGGVGLPGATTQVIFNDGGTNLAGDAGLVYNKTTDALTVAGLVTAGSASITGAATVGTTLGVTGVSTFAAGTALLPALTTTGDTNTGIYYPAADTFAVTTGGTERYRVNSAGNLGIGVTPSSWGSNSIVLQVGGGSAAVSSTGAGSTASRFTHGCYFDNTNWKYQNTSVGASLYEVTGANGGSTHAWYIAPGGTAGATITDFATAKMTLDASGNLLVASGVVRAAGRTEIGAGYIGDISGTGNNRGIFLGSTGIFPADGSGNSSDNTYDLGSATARWDTVFAGTGTINTSDRNEKQDISDLSASEKRVASSIKQLVKKYRFKDAVASKGENARIHVGWIAQDIQSAFAAEGLDASDYGMFCSDTWEENGVEKTRLGLRYDEVLAFVVSAI